MANNAPPKTAAPLDNEPPPILGSWGRMYALVILALCISVLIFALLSRAYA